MDTFQYTSRFGHVVRQPVVELDGDTITTKNGLILQVQDGRVFLSGGHYKDAFMTSRGLKWTCGNPHYYTPPKYIGFLPINQGQFND